MSRGRHLHVSLYRFLVALLPAAHRRRFGEAQVQLFDDLLRSGTRPATLWRRAVPDLVQTLVTTRGGRLASLGRIGIAGLSLANLALAGAVAAAAVGVAGAPLWVLAVCAGLAAQGAYALAWLAGLGGPGRAAAGWLFAAGESAALVVGVVGLAATVAIQARADFADPEYGPLTIWTFVTLHALFGLAVLSAERAASIDGQA